MGNTTYRRSDKNSKIKTNKQIIKQSIGEDIVEEDDEYNLDVYGEFIPSFDAWITPEEQKSRMKEILKGME